MLRKILALLLTLAALSFSGVSAENWNGWGDTIKVPACSSTVLVYGRTPFTVTDYDMIRVVAHVDDTTSAGFADDSVNVIWGYQTFSLCLNSSGTYDTCYSPRVVVDTISSDTFGVMQLMTLDGNGIAKTPSRQVDTLACSGWAVQSRTFSPEWDVYARLWVQGVAGNITAAPLKMQFTVVRRLYRGARGE